ncbi:hypothetical protein [Psychrilyobacter atlanticus]|uniref:hypothetical protein n=1 Tax=Psychrilyobacter atlanticus TaxID=271091 RepID=UPI0003FA05D6|nr:hypothetical protein [Psychrilyobacter atlanticus]
MKYNLFKKEPAPTWEEAKEKHIKSVSLDENRIDGKYEKAFPYDYDPEIHFVYEGELVEPYTIQSDFTLYFLNDREQIEKGYKILGIGEILEDNMIKTIPSPGEFYTWNANIWIYDKQSEIDSINNRIKAIETDLENRQTRLDSREKLGMKIIKPDPEIVKLLQLHADTSQELTLI